MAPDYYIDHSLYREDSFNNRFINHAGLVSIIEQIKLQNIFNGDQIGLSAQQRAIYKLSIGRGETTVMLWSQMHGNEPTGTLAFLDLFNFLVADDVHNDLRNHILDNCTLHFIPMVNPDGAEVFTRRNAQGIDINRDFIRQESPEAKLLVQMQQLIKPEFGFNMHDQETLWSVKGHKKPAAISLLAPPADEAATITPCRLKAMQVITALNDMLKQQIPGYIGRWSEEFEPRAFGDNFQRLGTATILVEAGGYPNDIERQYVRKLNFDILVHALLTIADRQFTGTNTSAYYAIPENNKEMFHLLIKNCGLNTAGGKIRADIGLNYSEVINLDDQTSILVYSIADIGDLSTWGAYETIEIEGIIADAPLTIETEANFSVFDNGKMLLRFNNGTRVE